MDVYFILWTIIKFIIYYCAFSMLYFWGNGEGAHSKFLAMQGIPGPSCNISALALE